MGILDDDDLMEIAQLVEEANKFKPQELNEANVQAIFNRCLYTLESKNRTEACPFYQRLGYSEEEANVIYFDRDTLLKNKSQFDFVFSVMLTPCTAKGLNCAGTQNGIGRKTKK